MREGILIQLPHTEKPGPKRFEEMAAKGQAVTGDLRSLVCGATTVPGMSAHIKMPTGAGSAFFDDHCIAAMKQAFCEGHDNA